MTKTRVLAATAAIATLSACGGATTSVASNPYDDLVARGLFLVSQSQADFDSDNFTDLSMLPRTGEANFNGYAAYDVGGSANSGGQDIIDNADYISEATVSINLGSDAVSGTFSNFYDTATQQRVAGNATWVGAMNRTDPFAPGITGSASGTLATTDGSATLTASIEAELYGDGSVVSGFVDALGRSSSGNFNVVGAFIADN